jgi:hypothetical protein
VLECITQVSRAIENSAIIDIGDVYIQDITIGIDLWGLYRYSALPGNPARSNLGHSAQQTRRWPFTPTTHGLFEQSLCWVVLLL